MVATMVPPATLTPSVLPTDRLGPTGIAVAELRGPLRRVASWRNAGSVVATWLQSFGLLVLAGKVVDRTGWWWLWIAAFVLMGRAHALFGILSHEAAHRLLFADQRVNDWVGTWLIGTEAFIGQEAYRRSHMAHHRDPLGPNEPDQTLYAGYPITMESFRRKLWRDATGQSGWKLLKGLGRNVRKPQSRKAVLHIIGVQIILAVALGVTVGWWVWPVMWLGSWMTVWRVISRLRAIAEHGGMTNSTDERLTTQQVRQTFAARFWMVPFHTGWHIAHHVDAGIPWRNLPAFHTELVRAGWVVPELEHRSYTALWRQLTSRPA